MADLYFYGKNISNFGEPTVNLIDMVDGFKLGIGEGTNTVPLVYASNYLLLILREWKPRIICENIRTLICWLTFVFLNVENIVWKLIVCKLVTTDEFTLALNEITQVYYLNNTINDILVEKIIVTLWDLL